MSSSTRADKALQRFYGLKTMSMAFDNYCASPALFPLLLAGEYAMLIILTVVPTLNANLNSF